MSWVDGRDVGEVAARVLTGDGHEGKAYALTGGQALSTGDAAGVLSRVLGHQYTYVNVPEEAAREGMEKAMPAWYVDGLLELSMLIRAGYAADVADGVETVLGRAPTPFATWAESLLG